MKWLRLILVLLAWIHFAPSSPAASKGADSVSYGYWLKSIATVHFIGNADRKLKE